MNERKKNRERILSRDAGTNGFWDEKLDDKLVPWLFLRKENPRELCEMDLEGDEKIMRIKVDRVRNEEGACEDMERDVQYTEVGSVADETVHIAPKYLNNIIETFRGNVVRLLKYFETYR